VDWKDPMMVLSRLAYTLTESADLALSKKSPRMNVNTDLIVRITPTESDVVLSISTQPKKIATIFIK
jgi:hypothetical protein